MNPEPYAYYTSIPDHPDYPRGTAAGVIMGDREAAFIIAPSDENAHTKFCVITLREGSQPAVEMTLADLDVLIAELQRARSGCFFDEYPKVKPEPATTVTDEVHNFYGDFAEYIEPINRDHNAIDANGVPVMELTPGTECSAHDFVAFLKKNMQPDEIVRVNALDIDVLSATD